MGSERVLLWPDTFNDHFRPENLIAATQLLERAGFEVAIPAEPLCCGRPLYDWGFLDSAKQRLERIFDVLRSDIDVRHADHRPRAGLRIGVQGRAAQPLCRTAPRRSGCPSRCATSPISSPTASTAFPLS